jgi:hypothetical protein
MFRTAHFSVPGAGGSGSGDASEVMGVVGCNGTRSRFFIQIEDALTGDDDVGVAQVGEIDVIFNLVICSTEMDCLSTTTVTRSVAVMFLGPLTVTV